VGVLCTNRVIRAGLKAMLAEAESVAEVFCAVERGIGALLECDVVIVLDDDVRLLPGDAGAVLVAAQTQEGPRDGWRGGRGAAGYFSVRDTTAPILNAFIQVGGAWADHSPSSAVALGPGRIGRSVEPRQRTFVTDRERETLELLAEGMSNDEIAARLSISTHGVKRLVGSIMVRLGARNRTSAVVIAIREGILDCPAVCQQVDLACPAELPASGTAYSEGPVGDGGVGQIQA
jgi:two-component system nitrate/nitrite response regulator NarL